MSFPPRPPPSIIQMGPMPPMMPNPYGYPPMGMPPMGMPPMGMNPMMSRPLGPPPNYPILNPAVNSLKAALSQPITKVFVGNISERVPDPMIRSMLLRCGNVMTWKRVEGPSGKLQAFGFCEYDNPQSTLRCIRLLNGYQLADKKLLVKVDQKTHDLLAEYIKKNVQSSKNAKNKSGLKNKRSTDDLNDDDQDESSDKINLELADEETHREDRIVLNALELILKQYQKDLNPPPPVVETPPPATAAATPPTSAPTSTTTISASATTTTTNTTVNSTIKTEITNAPLKSDDIHSNSTPNLSNLNNDKDRRDERSRSIEKSSRDRDRSERDRDRDRGRTTRGDSSPYKDRVTRNNSRSIERDPLKPSSKYYGSRSRTRSRSPIDHNNRRPRRVSSERTGASYRDDQRAKSPPSSRYSRTNSDVTNKENGQKVAPTPNLTQEELEEERERRKLERRLREKEQAYRDRLKEWEERESKKRRQYLSEKKTEMQRRKQLQKEAKKLRQFMEDYEDDKDDSNFYKGSNLEKKLKAREKEIEADNRDRQREKEELEELKKKLNEKGGFADVETEARKLHEDEHNRMKTKFEKLEQSSSSSSSSSSSEDEEDEQERQNTKQETIKHDDNENEEDKKNVITTPQINEEEEVSTTVQQAVNSNDSNSAPLNVTNNKNLISDDDSNISPSATNYADSPTINTKSDQINDNFSFSSPNSNSPLYLNNTNSNVNTTSSHYLPTTATHVTIKSFSTNTKNKSIQPIMNKAFADEDDESNGPQMKRAKLIALNESSDSKMNSEERKKAVKKLVESIPTDRDELFSYNVDWEQLDENLMEKRIKPWINKKIIEYIGEEEATLNDFICTKIKQRTNPEKLLEEVKVILDDEAELFVKKMWRLIVYETESKRQGLSK